MEMPQVPPTNFQEGPFKSGCGFKTSRCAEKWGEDSYKYCSAKCSDTAKPPPNASSSLEENIHYREEKSKILEALLALTSKETKK